MLFNLERNNYSVVNTTTSSRARKIMAFTSGGDTFPSRDDPYFTTVQISKLRGAQLKEITSYKNTDLSLI